MPEELNFRVARVGQPAHLFQDRCARAAALRPARERHDAIGARLVAALDDRQIGAKWIVAPRNFRFKGRVGVGVQAHDAAVSGFQLRNQIGQLAVTRRAAHQANPGRALEDLFAFLLRDAAQNADNFFFAGIFPVGPEAREYFLGGLFANAAGVIEDQPGRVDRFHLLVSAAEENSGHFLGIVDVHLAAERFQIESFVCRRAGGKAQLRARLNRRSTRSGCRGVYRIAPSYVSIKSYHTHFRGLRGAGSSLWGNTNARKTESG